MLLGLCYRCGSRGSQRGSDNKQLGFLGRIWMSPKPELFYNTLPFSDNIRKMAVTSRIRLSHQKEIRKKKSRKDEFISLIGIKGGYSLRTTDFSRMSASLFSSPVKSVSSWMLVYLLVTDQQILHGAEEKLASRSPHPGPQTMILYLLNIITFAR